jgi:hypothetical protein
MNGWELTTFDSSNDVNAARAGTKEYRARGQGKTPQKTLAKKSILYEVLVQNRQARILD